MHRFKRPKRTDLSVRFCFCTSVLSLARHEEIVHQLHDLHLHACEKLGLPEVEEIFLLKKHHSPRGIKPHDFVIAVGLNDGALPLVASINVNHPTIAVSAFRERLERYCSGGKPLVVADPEEILTNGRSFKRLMTKLLRLSDTWKEPMEAAM